MAFNQRKKTEKCTKTINRAKSQVHIIYLVTDIYREVFAYYIFIYLQLYTILFQKFFFFCFIHFPIFLRIDVNELKFLICLFFFIVLNISIQK